MDASAVTFEPAAGEMIGHMDSIAVQAVWRNAATGSEYTAEYKVTVDMVDGIYFAHAPNKTHYAEGEPLDLTGATVALKYKKSGDIVMVTPDCAFYPPSGEIMTPYGTSIHATYQTGSGDQYEAETLVNVQAMTVPIDVIGQIVGEELGLSFNDDLPSDFWDDFYPQDVPYIPADGDYYLSEDTYSSIVDYLAQKGAFADYRQYGDIPYMVLPAGSYPSADGRNAIEARADIYIIAAMMKKDGRPQVLPGPSCVDYPYTNLYVYNQIVEPYFLPSFMQTETADYFNRNNKRYWHFCFPEEQIMPIPVFISLNVMYDLNVKSIRKGKDSRTHKSLTAHPGTPTMHMLQDSLLHFKNYVKKYPGKDILSMTLEDCMEIIMDHSLSENTGRFHTYLTESGKKKCRSRSLAVSGGYSRTLITFENGERKEERVDISVYRCRTCGHYHAVLPYHVIIPYVSYSVQFILSLFIDRKVRKMTVSALLRKYGLSRTTYYRLLKKLAPYYVIHRMTRDSYGMSLFVQAQADGRRLLDSVFTASCMALMEGSRTLHKQRPTSGTSPSLPE